MATDSGRRVTDLVVIVPGILGSRLQRNGVEVWGTGAQRLVTNMSTFGRTMKSALAIPTDVDPDDPDDGVEPVGLITGLTIIPGLLGMDFYDRLRSSLRRSLELGPGQLLDFSYDWRLSCRLNGARLKEFLDHRLRDYRQGSGITDARAVLVCHSMGGLVARWCADREGGNEQIRMLITIGTPHKGSIIALDGLANGVRLPRRIGVDLSAMALSFPALYELLPTYSCVQVGESLLPLSDPIIQSRISTLCPVAVNDLESRIQRGLSLHTDLVENVPTGGPSSYELVCLRGTDQSTPVMATWKHGELMTTDRIGDDMHGGDGVVPADSGLPSFWTETSRGKPAGGKHSTMTGGKGVLEELRIALRHTGRLQSETVPVSARMPTEVPAGHDFQVEFEAVPDARGRRPPLNLQLQLEPVESSLRSTLVSRSAKTGQSYVAKATGLPPGLYRVRLVPVSRSVRQTDDLQDWLVVYEDARR